MVFYKPESARLIGTFQSEIEAQMIKAKLEEQGIPSWLFKDDAGSMGPPLQMVRGVELYVAPSDLELAHEILEAVEEDADMMIPIEMETPGGGNWVVWILVIFAIVIVVLGLLHYY